MDARTLNNLPTPATHDGPARCLIAIELSKRSWVVAVNTPLSEKISRYTLKACDAKELLELIEKIRTRIARELKQPVEVVAATRPAMTDSGSAVCSKQTAYATMSSIQQVCKLIVGRVEPKPMESMLSDCSDH